MIFKNTLIFIILFLLVFPTFSAETRRELLLKQEEIKKSKKRTPKYHYGYLERKHSLNESLRNIGLAYGITWALYPLTQPDYFRKHGSWENYKNNFGKIVFDQDAPFWNWFAHPISGGQLYLYYRANSYSRIGSLGMAAISSALFEFTVEVWQEPASIQDLYQTPILGSILGLGIEGLSMYLLNTGNLIGKILGHTINPSTLFWFYEGKITITPAFDGNGKTRVVLRMDF